MLYRTVLVTNTLQKNVFSSL